MIKLNTRNPIKSNFGKNIYINVNNNIRDNASKNIVDTVFDNVPCNVKADFDNYILRKVWKGLLNHTKRK
jgi:hypothetical protein